MALDERLEKRIPLAFAVYLVSLKESRAAEQVLTETSVLVVLGGDSRLGDGGIRC